MSIEEKNLAQAVAQNKSTSPFAADGVNQPSQYQTFIQGLRQGADRGLVRPFGVPNWPVIGAAFAFALLALVLFSHIIDLGKVATNWKLTFNVNLVAGLLVILAGAIAIVPKAIRNPRSLRSQNTLAPIILLALVALFFFVGVFDFGEFVYTLNQLDVSSVLGLIFLVPVLVLAIRGSKIAVGILIVFFLWWGFSIKAFGFETVIDLFTSTNGGRLLRSLTPPRWTYFNNVIDPMLLTIQTAIAGTVIGVAIALPLSILAARNTTPHPVIYNIVRFLINTVRAIPALVLALLFIPFVGLGPGAGVLGLGIHSISVLTKLFSEAFESVKPQPQEALKAVGASGFETFRWAVFPQAFPLIASYSIFNWESNGRDSTVVAFVGGGGIGFLLQANLSLLDYANVSVILIVLVLTVALLDRFSDFVRSRII